MKYYNNKTRQAGMTLIELTVVLLVLIGLAGLLIPYVSGFVTKTHDSTGTNNLAGLNGNFARFENEYMRQPDRLESLVDNSDQTIYKNMMNTGMFRTVTVDSDGGGAGQIIVESLDAAGMSTVMNNDDTTENATFVSTVAGITDLKDGLTHNLAALCGIDPNPMMPVSGATCTRGSVAGSGNDASGEVAEIEDHLADAFGGVASDYDATCYEYIALGVGDKSELVGRTLNSAPIHFATNGDMGPVKKYNRFVVVYRVDRDNSTAGCSTTTEPAKFIGSAMAMMEGHLWGVGHSAGHSYENLANNN